MRGGWRNSPSHPATLTGARPHPHWFILKTNASGCGSGESIQSRKLRVFAPMLRLIPCFTPGVLFRGGLMSKLKNTFKVGGDIEVNRLGFGAMRLTGKGIWGEPRDANEAKRVLKRAVELGANFIDTADSYGPEVSERLIGEALAPYSKGLVIATKGGLTR